MTDYRLTPNRKKILEAAANIMENLAKYNHKHCSFTSPSDTRSYLTTYFAGQERESFVVLWLTTQHELIAAEELFKGTIDSSAVYPREVVKAALKHNAAACILAHNHPSGIAEPSYADQRITDRLKMALDVVDIKVLDHMVVGGAKVVSFSERGLL